MNIVGALVRQSMERDGHCGVSCVDCHQPIGHLSIDATGRPHVVSLYRQHESMQLDDASGRHRVALHCPFCKVTRASNTPKSLLRAYRAGDQPVAH